MATEKIGLQAVFEGASQYIGNLKSAADAENKLAHGADAAAKSTDAMGKSTDQTAAKAKAFDGVLTKVGLLMTGAFAVGIGLAAKSAADFEFRIDQVGAVAGATEAEIGSLSATAKTLGAETAFSAGEAAAAMEELAAGGRSVAQIVGGEAKAAVDLAAAGNYGLADSARTIATTMDIWKDSSIDMTDVVNRLAGAANTSRFGVDDMAAAIAQGGGAAATAGVSFQDFSTAIAATAANFASGSDAGTSFKTFVLNLSPASEKAKDLIKELGLEFFNAQGEMRPMAAIVQELHDKIGPLTAEQETLALKTIFGNDAFRTAAGLMKLTGEEFTAMSAKMGATDAAEVAAQRMGNLKGDIEQLKGSLETMAITIGEKVLPILSNLVGFGTEVVNGFSELPTTSQNVLLLGTAIVGLAPLISKGVNAGISMIKMLGNLSSASTGAKVALGVGGLAAAVTILDTVLASITGKGLFERVIDFFDGGASTAEKASGRLKEFQNESLGVADKAEVMANAVGNINSAQDALIKKLEASTFGFTAGGEAIKGSTLSVIGMTDSTKGLVAATQEWIDKADAGNSTGAEFKKIVDEAKVEVFAMAAGMREAGATGAEMSAVWAGLNPLLQQAFEDGSNWEAVVGEMTVAAEKNARMTANMDLAIAGLNVQTEEQIVIIPRAVGAIESWAEAVSLTSDGVVDLSKKIEALTSLYAAQNPAVAALNAENAILQEELDDLTFAGETYSEKLGLTTEEIQKQIDTNSTLAGTYASNQTAVEGMTQALTIAMGEEGFAGLIGVMADAKISHEDQIDILGSVVGAYDTLTAGAIPEAISSFDELKGQLAPEVWAPLAEAIGPDLVRAIDEGIADPIEKAKLMSAVEVLVGDGIGAGKAEAAKAYAIGSALINGAVEGVRNGGGALSLAFTQVLNNAIASGQFEIEARSPSKRTEREIGRPIVDGIVVGIESGRVAVASSINSMGELMLAELSDGLLNWLPTTTDVLATWRALLQVGLNQGIPLAKAEIETLISELKLIIENSELPEDAKAEALETLLGLAAGFAEGGGIANQALIDLINQIVATLEAELPRVQKAAIDLGVAATPPLGPGGQPAPPPGSVVGEPNDPRGPMNSKGQPIPYRNESGALVVRPGWEFQNGKWVWDPHGTYNAAHPVEPPSSYTVGRDEDDNPTYDPGDSNYHWIFRDGKWYLEPKPGTAEAAAAAGTPLRSGMSYVPYDNFPAVLHRGEAVLTREEAAVHRNATAGYAMLPGVAGAGGGMSFSIDLRGAQLTGTVDENRRMITDVVNNVIARQLGRDAIAFGRVGRI